MAAYDFDTPINRYGTDSLKFDSAEARHRDPSLLSLWVADMDFRAPDEVIDALVKRSQHGVFGYTEPGEAYFARVKEWLGTRYGLYAESEQIVPTPGIVFALAMSVQAFTEPGDAVLYQPPVYYPFSGVIQANGRTLAKAPLTYEDGRYRIDFDAFEAVLASARPKLFLLCNPHNPVGRAWTPDELARLRELCAAYGTLVVSDEIHMDFARPGHTHTPLATVGDDAARSVITCTSASKTFNLAGLQTANIIIPDEELRAQFKRTMGAAGYSQLNALGLTATHAAYKYGGPWLDQLKNYLEGNWALLGEWLDQPESPFTLVPAESTYLAWIDCRALGLGAAQLERFVEDEAGLWLDCGHIFGPEGEGFIRINIATQRAYLGRALTQLLDAAARLMGVRA